MTELTVLANWLKLFPMWDGPVYVDYSDGMPGSISLYPLGLTEVSRRMDVAGNVRTVNRLTLTLYRLTPDNPDSEENARWMLQLQTWIRQQSALGLAPVLGDVPQEEYIRAEKGRLSRIQYVGCACYAVDLTAEFIKLH